MPGLIKAAFDENIAAKSRRSLMKRVHVAHRHRLRRAAVRALAQLGKLRLVAAFETRGGRQAGVNAPLAQFFGRIDQRPHFSIKAGNQHVEAFDLTDRIKPLPEGFHPGPRVGHGEGGIWSVFFAEETAFE